MPLNSSNNKLIVCGFAHGHLGIRAEAEGSIRPHLKAIGNGTIPISISSEGEGTYVHQVKAVGGGAIDFVLFTRATGRVVYSLSARAESCPPPLQSIGTGRPLNPIRHTYCLLDLIPYLSNFIPELDGMAPSPLPEQTCVRLDVLQERHASVDSFADRRVWCLMGVSFNGRPVMLLKNTPVSLYPSRSITSVSDYKQMVAYLARLWQCRPISAANAKSVALNNQFLEEPCRRVL